MLKLCTRCNTEKLVMYFYKADTPDGYHRKCKECLKKYSKEIRHKKLLGDMPKYKYIELLHKRIQKKAEKIGLEFNLELSDIDIPEVCPYLNIPIELSNRTDVRHGPSVDRIDNSKGYIKGNIQIISWKANTMKNSASVRELKTFARNVLRLYPD